MPRIHATTQLEESNRRIAEAEQRIIDQQARVAELEREGQNSASSRELLRLFENSLALLRSQRAVLQRDLKESSN
jgi:hypothetical protein